MQETNNVSGGNVPGALGVQMSAVAGQNREITYADIKSQVSHHLHLVLQEWKHADMAELERIEELERKPDKHSADLSPALARLERHVLLVNESVLKVAKPMESFEVHDIEQFYLCCATRYKNYSDLCAEDGNAQNARDSFLETLSGAYSHLSAKALQNTDKERLLSLSKENKASEDQNIGQPLF